MLFFIGKLVLYNYVRAICASCLMFGEFKGHEVISLEEANVKLRKELD